MDRRDDLGPGQGQQIVVALEVVIAPRLPMRVVASCRRKALAAIAGFIELIRLDHRAHRTVDDQDAVLSASSSVCTRSGLRQGRVQSRLSRQQRQHFEMRRLAFARQLLAREHVESGLAREAAQLVGLEAEIAVIERLDRVRCAWRRASQISRRPPLRARARPRPTACAGFSL